MLKEKYNKEIEVINFESQDTIEQLDNKVKQLVKENEDLKIKLIDCERDYTELHSNYERDKASWDERCEFIENQRNQAKQDLRCTPKVCDNSRATATEGLFREREDRECPVDSGKNIEKKYKEQTKDINESHASTISDWSSHHKSLEKKYKELCQKCKIESLGKISEGSSWESKIRDLPESEQYYQEENKKLKSQLDKQFLEIQLLLEKEKINYKHNLEILEKKCKDSESKRSLQIFEHEKERPKWALEKEKIKHEYDLLKDKNRKSASKKESLEKEVVKVETDIREPRKVIHSGGVSSSTATKELANKKVRTTSNVDS
ncbi:unnamed protein product [Moneuplotes crassus]|uniref:Uncharacterized protein n=1 Tax=Euplotes crassus TaxID=5936 RepID=A0AAD1U699_EUPCR|nr:unnamed protein product [Moneuplotes crassus]